MIYKLIAGVVVVALLLFALDCLGLWLERKGWLYYRKSEGRHGSTAMGNIFGAVQTIYQPAARYEQEAKQEEIEQEENDLPFDPCDPDRPLKISDEDG